MTENIPLDIEAEMALLGCVFVNKSARNYAMLNIQTEYFHDVKHKTIWKALRNLYSDNKGIDEITVKAVLEESHLLERAGGIDYIVAVSSTFPVAYNINEYCEIVIEKYQQRRILDFAKYAETTIAKGGDWSETLPTISDGFHSLTNSFLLGDKGTVELKKIAVSAVKSIENRGELSGILTGFPTLDRLTGGLMPSNVVIIAANTSKGKTSLALNITTTVAKQGKAILFISLEMSSELLLHRILSSESFVGNLLIKQHTKGAPKLFSTEFANLYKAAEEMKKFNMSIGDKGRYTVQHIAGLARQKQQSKGGLDLIVIDYLQLVSPDTNQKSNNRNNEVAAISRDVKLLAQELKVPILLLSQLNRDANDERPPVLSNLRDSGAIEQDADIVLFLHYPINELGNGNKEEMDRSNKWHGSIYLSKHRNGPNGLIPIYFQRDITTFFEHQPSKDDYEETPFGGV